MTHKEDCRRYRERNPNVDKIYYETHKEEILAKQNTPEFKEKKKEYNRQYRLANREKILALKRKYYHANREIIIGKSKEWSKENREKINKRVKINRDKNRDKMREYSTHYNQEYYQEHREEIKNHVKEYIKNNSEKVSMIGKKWRENNKERKAENDRRWRENNPEKVLAHTKSHFERYFQLTKDIYPHIKNSVEFRFAIMTWGKAVKKRDGYKCTRCGTKDKLHAHHIIPKSVDPTKILDIDNGKTLCKECHVLTHREMKLSLNTPKRETYLND